MALQWEVKSDKLTLANTPFGRIMIVKRGIGEVYYDTVLGWSEERLEPCTDLDLAKSAAQEKFDAALNLALPFAYRNDCREALSYWTRFNGDCPECGYDCASANPPVNLCPVQNRRKLLTQL